MPCDLQSLNLQLSDLKPPIPRDRLIFEEVLVQGRGQQEVAQEHGISQPRVSKILAEVGTWLCRVLPESVAQERPEGQVALGLWLVQARLDFLYHKALAGLDASGQDKVVVKQGKRGEVAWETTSSTTQTPSAGFINGALRAVLASSRLYTAAAKSSGNTRQESVGMVPQNSVMSKSAKIEELPPMESPQTQVAQDLTDVEDHSREETLKAVIKLLRESPQRAHWTDNDFREAAQRRLAILDAAHRENEEQQQEEAAVKATSVSKPIAERAEPQPSPSQPEPASLSLDAARLEKLRREREKRKCPEQRRREFLAQLKVG